MTDKLFYKLWTDAIAQPDREMYISEYGYPEWFNEISDDAAEITSVLCNIHDAAHMSVREIIKEFGLTQAAFAEKFCIPLRTVEDWVREKSKCADYYRLMLMQFLGVIRR